MSKSRRIEAGHMAWRGLVGAAGAPDTRAGPGLVTLPLRCAVRIVVQGLAAAGEQKAGLQSERGATSA